MAKADFYETLGVARTASEDEIKKAFRKLAMQHHPDRNQGDKGAEKKFKEINEAYDVLKDADKRAAYDRMGHAAFEAGGGRGHPGGPGGGPWGFDFSSNFADIFDEMFGEMGGGRRGGGARGGQRGQDLRYNLEISLVDAFRGSQATIKVPTLNPCEGCNGTGAEKGSQPVTCGTCGGVGRVRAQQGFFTIERTCSACQGAGKVIRDPCKQCNGIGRLRREKTLQVQIPAGVEDGTRIRLAGEGEAGMRGAPPGDLYVFLAIKQHPFFERDGANLKCRAPIPMTLAALGGQIEAPTIEGGRARVAIPAGAQSGQVFRLKGKGMSVLRSPQRGDLYIEIHVETPRNLSTKQKDLLKEFDSAGKGADTSPESSGFFAKVKELLDDLKG